MIKRDQLRDLSSDAGMLLHELTHASMGTDDRTLEFEEELTSLLGVVTKVAINR